MLKNNVFGSRRAEHEECQSGKERSQIDSDWIVGFLVTNFETSLVTQEQIQSQAWTRTPCRMYKSIAIITASTNSQFILSSPYVLSHN